MTNSTAQNTSTAVEQPLQSPESSIAPQATATPLPSSESIASALMSALDGRTKRVESSVAKSMAEQYGMSEDDIAKILQEEKTKRAARLPPEQQQMLKTQLAKASSMLLSADVKALGAEMGLLDAPAALLLMQKDGIKIEEDGTVSGTKEALETLKKEKPYLFGAAGAWADKHGEPSTALTGVEAAFAKLNPDLKL